MRGYDFSQIVFGILILLLLIIVPYVLLSKALLNLSFDTTLNNGYFQTTNLGPPRNIILEVFAPNASASRYRCYERYDAWLGGWHIGRYGLYRYALYLPIAIHPRWFPPLRLALCCSGLGGRFCAGRTAIQHRHYVAYHPLYNSYDIGIQRP